MHVVDWIIVSVVILWAAIALFLVFRSHKKGKTCSCGGDSACVNCASCHKNDCPKKKN